LQTVSAEITYQNLPKLHTKVKKWQKRVVSVSGSHALYVLQPLSATPVPSCLGWLKVKIFNIVVWNTRVIFRRVFFQTTNDSTINSKSTGNMYFLFYIILIDCYTVRILIVYILSNINISFKTFLPAKIWFLIFPGGK